MKIKTLNLETVCGITSKLPENNKVEMAFIGRSNVGKSSLINTLLNRKSLARTSAQPGKTQTVNYYNINDVCYFVDLPGYGYAKVSKEIKQKWSSMIDNYFNTSKMLRVVFLLIDIRHEPSEKDIEMYNKLIMFGFSPLIIATKADKMRKSYIDKQVSLIRKTLKLVEGTPVILFSSLSNAGKDEVWDYIDEYVEMFNEEDCLD